MRATVVLAIRAFNATFAQRVRAARERLSKRLGRQVSQREMARMLSKDAGCMVSEGTYRKYENSNKPVLMPLGLLWYFAKLTDTTLETLLAPVAHPGFAGYQVSADDIRKYGEGSVPMPHHLLFPFCLALRMPLEELLAPVLRAASVDPRDASGVRPSDTRGAVAAPDVIH
jgi:transcriptional regulator with XRE-family HTH domain